MKAQYKEIEEKMNKTLDALYREFGTIRAGKASPSVLDRVTVDYYGAATPIQQLATISTADARTLVIQPWDKSTLKLINKAIQASDIGINPTDEVDKFKAQKKANEISEDDLKDAEKDVQDLTDKYVKMIDKAVKDKEQEVMSL